VRPSMYLSLVAAGTEQSLLLLLAWKVFHAIAVLIAQSYF